MNFPFQEASYVMQFVSIFLSILLAIGLLFGIYKLIQKIKWG
ncbi:MAG: hypothetical protein QXG39_06220 [Candidatus Aenigmatarchaeota archaeon]